MMRIGSRDAGMGAGPGSEIRLTNELAIYVGVALRVSLAGSHTSAAGARSVQSHSQLVPMRR